MDDENFGFDCMSVVRNTNPVQENEEVLDPVFDRKGAIKGFKDWLVSRGNEKGYATWWEMCEDLEEAMYGLRDHYWPSFSSSSMMCEFKEGLERLEIFEFVRVTDHLRGRIDDPDRGTIEIGMRERSDGALRDIVARTDCRMCGEKRYSLPLTEGIHLVAFANGADSPCPCQCNP